MFKKTPVVKQKIFGTRPGVQSPEKLGSQAVREVAGTGTCFYFLPLPTPSASGPLVMGISDEFQNSGNFRITNALRAARCCNHCNAGLIFPATIQAKKRAAHCTKHLDKVLCNHSSKPTQK